MLLFLAPTLLLTPAQIVSADGEAVVQEVTATFTFNETEAGDWWTFTPGSNEIDASGLCLEQYTRPNVVRNTTLPGCGFRNYTTGSGNVTGGLNGTLWLEWLTFNFNQTYPYTPKYMTANHFGFIMGRGHIGENLTFVFVADFDSDDATMSNAAGKGFMLSVNETGDFAGYKIIGDFNITKTGTSWGGTFNLRNYAPNEVYDLSWLNVTGGVLQESTDPISTPLALLSYLVDGPFTTPTNITTDFEEVAWGRDPIKTVTSGHLGVNGTMDLSRNTALYLELMGSTVRIQGTTACNLFINDTYAVTGDDGSPYGKLYELLLLYIPDQTLPVGDFFYQNGYTFTPFGMMNPSTDCYAGTESWALAGVAIESSIGDAQQWSVDHSYGLYPHPKVESVTPSSGAPGETLNVNINGKYFLRANGTVPNSGSVDFGAGITVNSYSITNSSPIDNEIVANITIAPDATPGVRDVNVTACFGYSNGNGTGPYKSGHDVFNVSAAATTLKGNVTFKSRGTPPDARWAEPFLVRAFEAGNLSHEIWNATVSTDAYGVFRVENVTPGTYDIRVKNWTCLSERVDGVVLTAGNITEVNFGETREGDSDGNNAVTGMDFSLLSGAFGSTPANPAKWNAHCDFDRNNAITGMDFSLLSGDFNKVGR